jgi:nucleotidyltransferase/DNA polymerase involved in DNA repair
MQVADILSRLAVTERASIDEVYLDVTAEAGRRLAALPAGSTPPEPVLFMGMHVAGHNRVPQAVPDLGEIAVTDAGLGGEPAGTAWPYPDAASDYADGYVGGAGLAQPACNGAVELCGTYYQLVDNTAPCEHGSDEGCASVTLSRSAVDPLESAACAAQAWWRRRASIWDEDDANARLLAAGAAVVSELRADVLRLLGFTCSAGVSHHKILSKLGSGAVR